MIVALALRQGNAWSWPVEQSHLALYGGKADAYAIDTVEPACCSSGIAIVLPDKDGPSGGSKCWAGIGLASIDVGTASRIYDKRRVPLAHRDISHVAVAWFRLTPGVMQLHLHRGERIEPGSRPTAQDPQCANNSTGYDT